VSQIFLQPPCMAQTSLERDSDGPESVCRTNCDVLDVDRVLRASHVDEEKETHTHSKFVSLIPKWTGQTQPRMGKIEGDTLRLGPETPIRSAGSVVISYLEWKRGGREYRTPVMFTNLRSSLTRRARNHGGYETRPA
jgi:hypothetical protein